MNKDEKDLEMNSMCPKVVYLSPGYERGKGGKNISIPILVLEASNRPKSFISEVLCISSAATQLSPGVCKGHFSRIFRNIGKTYKTVPAYVIESLILHIETISMLLV